MHAKTNRRNHDFQIAHFLAGSCHTPDAAYALLCDLREEREDAIKALKATELRSEAKRLRAQAKIDGADAADRLEGQADLAEIEAFADTSARCVAAAHDELAYINKCIEELQSQRKYAHLPDREAHEAAQREEWRLEFIRRAENFLATGGIPADEFAAMRLHPEFATHILPAMDNARLMIGRGEMQKLIAPPTLKLAVNK